VEKLGELLNENPDGLLVIRDELTGWLKQLEKHGHEQDRAFYLEAWNGEGAFAFDRIGRGTTYIRNLTISLLGTIQPSMIEPYFRSAMNGSGDDGLIQRFQLLVYPEVGKQYKYIDRPPAGRETARQSFENLYRMPPKDVDARFLTPEAGGHAFLQFDPEGQEFFETWLTEMETDLRSGSIQSPALESHISKYRSLMPSLALLFHLLKRVNGETSSSSIDTETVMLAAAWCSYLQRHAEKLYTLASLSEFDCAREILKRIRSGELGTEFAARDIYVKHWKRLSNSEDVKRGLQILSDHGHLEAVRLETNGRAKTVYVVHESLRQV
jgi:putative DNA primase/helicase